MGENANIGAVALFFPVESRPASYAPRRRSVELPDIIGRAVNEVSVDRERSWVWSP